jgi:hypothetical protein
MLINHEINSRGTFFSNPTELSRAMENPGVQLAQSFEKEVRYGFPKVQLIDQVERQTNIAMED